MKLWRGPFGVSLRACLRGAAAPTALAACAAVLGARLGAPVLTADEDATAAVTLWLTLPLLVTALACSLIAARTWPTFAAQRDGADTIRRIARGPLGGRGAVVLGAIVAQLALCIPLSIGLTATVGVPSTARRHVELTPDGPAVLDRRGAALTLALPAPLVADAVWLRPRAALPTGPDATAVRVESDSGALSSVPVEFLESLELVHHAVSPPPRAKITLTQISGHLPLHIDPGSVVVVGADALPRWANSAMLALLSSATTLVALLLAGLLGRISGWPTVAATIATTQFVQWVTGLGPVGDAVL
ncbi:MAG: hypothetical protein VYD05_10195, partial [Planctomycetota bacterium]|nr:hypothetical protein [Planctomycetota bacterium]